MANLDGQPESVDLHVGALIRRRRQALGLSQQRLADDLGLTFQQVQRYEGGDNRVSASKLYEISRSLQTSVAYFFEGLDYPAAAGGDHAAERIMAEFLATPAGLELASLLPRLRHGRARRRVLDLVRTLPSMTRKQRRRLCIAVNAAFDRQTHGSARALS